MGRRQMMHVAKEELVPLYNADTMVQRQSKVPANLLPVLLRSSSRARETVILLWLWFYPPWPPGPGVARNGAHYLWSGGLRMSLDERWASGAGDRARTGLYEVRTAECRRPAYRVPTAHRIAGLKVKPPSVLVREGNTTTDRNSTKSHDPTPA